MPVVGDLQMGFSLQAYPGGLGDWGGVQEGLLRGVLQDAEGHVGIVSGLELEQDQNVQLGVAAPDPPDGVAVASPPLVADVLGGELVEGGEVDGVDPVAPDEAAEQILDQTGESEQALVVLVVHLDQLCRVPRPRTS